MKKKIFTAVLFAVGVIMVSIYWSTGKVTVGVIGYGVLFIAFLLSFMLTIRAKK